MIWAQPLKNSADHVIVTGLVNHPNYRNMPWTGLIVNNWLSIMKPERTIEANDAEASLKLETGFLG